MSIEDEIAAVKAAAAKKLHRLRDQERKQQQALDQRVIVLLREQHPEVSGQLDATAREQLAIEKIGRSRRAQKMVLPQSVGAPPQAPSSNIDPSAFQQGAERIP